MCYDPKIIIDIDMCIFSYIFNIDFYHLLANYLQIMDKRYLIVFKLYFQSESYAQKQKEVGDTIGSSGFEERRKKSQILKLLSE